MAMFISHAHATTVEKLHVIGHMTYMNATAVKTKMKEAYDKQGHNPHEIVRRCIRMHY